MSKKNEYWACIALELNEVKKTFQRKKDAQAYKNSMGKTDEDLSIHKIKVYQWLRKPGSIDLQVEEFIII